MAPRSFLKFVCREPLVHFLLAAGLLFVAHALFSGDEREVIIIDTATQEFLIQQQQDLLLRPLTDKEEIEVIESFVEDEILAREARKRGLGNSSRIRRLLIQNMRFFMASDLALAGEEELRSWFEANPERFESPPSVTYDHVYFADPETVPADVLDRLEVVNDYTKVGDFNNFGAQLLKMDQRSIARSFGREEAPRVLAMADQGWHGPFITPQGAHFLRIAERHPPSQPSFEQAKKWLEQEWMMTKSREIMDRELKGMRKNYRIEVLEHEQRPQ